MEAAEAAGDYSWSAAPFTGSRLLPSRRGRKREGVVGGGQASRRPGWLAAAGLDQVDGMVFVSLVAGWA